MNDRTAQTAETRRHLGLLFGSTPGAVFEIRALNVPAGRGRPYTLSGYFDDLDLAAAAAVEASEKGASGVYVTLNPVQPALLARAANRMRRSEKGGATKDTETETRLQILLDLDPKRPPGISASESEKEAALTRARAIGRAMDARGWPRPFVLDSGNGVHLDYRMDLPADDGGLTERCLKALAAEFSDDVIEVDTTVANAAQITKLAGTTARKGDSTPDRPHRVARLLDVPDVIEPVPPRKLQDLAAKAPRPADRARPAGTAPDLERVGSALAYIGGLGRLPYDPWFKLPTAVLDALGGDLGEAEALLVHHIGEDTPGEYAAKLADRVTAGTLFHLAKEAGWTWNGARDTSRDVHSRSSPPKGSGSGMNGAERSEPASSGAVSIGTLTEPPAREWTVAGLIPEGAPSILAGHSGLGKSYVALFLAICVCLGRAFLGRDVRRASVLWVDRELDLDETTRRAFAVARGMGLERPPETLFYLRPLKPVGTDETQEEILDAIEQHGVGLTILDSLTLGAIGDAKEQRDVVPLMRAVEAWGTSLCIDHITKAAAAGNQSSASIFGSGMKRAIARSTFNLVPAGDALTLHPDKTNFGPASSPLHFLSKHGQDERDRPEVVFEQIEAGHEALAGAEDHAPAHEQTLFALIRLHDETGKPVPLAMLAADRDVKTTTLRNHLSKLGDQVEKHGDNTYSPRSLPITAPRGSGSGVNGDASHSPGHSSPGMSGSERGDGSATGAPDLAEPWDAEEPF